MQLADNQHFTPPYFQQKEDILNNLTSQELKISKLASTDLSNKEIANQLCISDQTAKKHRQNIYEKLNLKGKSEIRRFLRHFESVFK
jgi:NarL family two-component system response regulator LiaR